ncbi:glycerophosphocholine phosphodiesterase GPCPD1 isoform X1 [Neodiprion pinetum]|uniref:Glycerophosphocholine phosphodiesterase GPCPD1 isoform X1 n=2 Tax=Neodiprion lecontei TaxID=441921 RepID=A0ABM3FLM9_NEOLC|nr:glycerophosphocholine phosphodiesterase GPCPD1-like isoform X1 [Neodiprion pinetum]XP_046588916.1 glycerophosphocholine phosphodiesterase GPCPD1 isoform X1 [Neodiprion lecontei]
MQRMWFLESEEDRELRRLWRPRSAEESEREVDAVDFETITMKGAKRDWIFRVQVSNLEKNELVYVVGNLPELGAWNHNQAIQLPRELTAGDAAMFDTNNSSYHIEHGDERESIAGSMFDNGDDEAPVYSQTICLPTDVDVEFRYFIAVVCQPNGTKNSAKTLIIRKWETHMTPRLIKKNAPSNFSADMNITPDKFGFNNGYFKVERGWLTDETVIQFKIFNSPLKLWKERLHNKKVYIKMTPVNLMKHNSLELQQLGGDCVEDSLSMDTQDIVEQPPTSVTEICVLNDEDVCFKYQDQFGHAYRDEEFIVFNVAVRYPETIAYLVDYYAYSSRIFPGEPPNHIGFSYILPSTVQASVGLLTVPITSNKHRPIGQLTIEYVRINPIPDYPWDMSISYAKHWEQRWSGLDVGHRGLGTSFKFEMKNCANVRENTIASLKTAADHGADMVEFDVQLSKDLIPVIYHDFYVSISLKRKKQIEAMDMLEIPVKDLTLEQLHLLKVYHLAEGREKNPRFFDEDLEDHQPFPTLKTVFQELEPHVGCNVEIKWNMQLKDGTFELNHPFDLNLYLDIIIKVVLEYGANRKIVFSSFNPDICMMIRLKQNKYPVVFLTQGITLKYPTYHDLRCQTIPMAMKHALAADILGINVHTEDILRDPSQVKLVKDAGLIIFCWGDDNNDKDTILNLKKLGLHAVIYDKIDEYNQKEVKESIFLVDARESEKALIALAHCSQTCGPPQLPPASAPNSTEKGYFLELEKTRNLVVTASTATSLGSLAKNSIGGDSVYPIKNITVNDCSDDDAATDCL